VQDHLAEAAPRVAIGAGFSAAILKMFDEDDEFEASGGRFTGGEERLLDVGGEGLFLLMFRLKLLLFLMLCRVPQSVHLELEDQFS